MPATQLAFKAPTQEEVEAYRRDGFIIARGLYGGEEMLEWKRIIQAVIEKERQAQVSDEWDLTDAGVRVWMADVIHPTLREAMRDPRVTPILQQLIGPNVEFLSAKAVFKNNVTAFGSPWHQDWFYWEGAPKLSVWIAMDAATVSNGCLKVIPGTHTRVFPKKVVRTNAFVNQIDDKELEGLPVVTAEVARGDAIFFSDLLVHGSHPNTVKADRWSLITTYRDASVKDDSKIWDDAMLISGTSVNRATIR